jgi:CBS domain-containing protein
MPDSPIDLLRATEPFGRLPPEVLEATAAKLDLITYPKGSVLTVQGQSTLAYVYILRSGTLELYFEHRGEKTLQGALSRGDIFGGISILMNAGLSIRSLRADTDASMYRLPRQDFLALCRRFRPFDEHFTRVFAERMRSETYAEAIAAAQIVGFLARIPPFSFLPEKELQEIAPLISGQYFPKDTVVFTQGESRVDGLLIIKQGAVERFFEEGGRKTLHGVLGEGDLFGGISMLVNDMLAVRTLRTIEDTQCYRLPHAAFFDLCRRHESFSEFFTDALGRRMLDRSYAAVIAKNAPRHPDSLPLLNQPVTRICSRNLVCGEMDLSIQEAAERMSRRRCSSIFVLDPSGRVGGVVTDNDLRTKVIAKGVDVRRPVAEIMSSPIISIAEDALVFEALMAMMKNGVKHLAVTDARGRVVGVMTHHDVAAAQGQSPLFLVREIATAADAAEIARLHGRLAPMVQRLIGAGTPAQHINRFITAVSDAVLQKVVELSIAELGAPPARYAFMIMGSEGRREQTLKTDQDNAIVFEDVEADRLESVQSYFLALGDRVCTRLDGCGYRFCKADVMARNPKLCQPLAVWKRRFVEWIHTAEAEDLLYSSIFFDFRHGHGHPELVHALRAHLSASLVGWSGFFRHLTQNALLTKPPIGFFRNFVVESKGDQRHKLDVKRAMMPIVDYARVYALNQGVEETNTLDRLNRLMQRETISSRDFNEIEQGYSFLMQLRLARQVSAVLDEGAPPDNHVNPKELSGIEQRLLKEIFVRSGNLQTRMSFDFTGEP